MRKPRTQTDTDGGRRMQTKAVGHGHGRTCRTIRKPACTCDLPGPLKIHKITNPTRSTKKRQPAVTGNTRPSKNARPRRRTLRPETSRRPEQQQHVLAGPYLTLWLHQSINSTDLQSPAGLPAHRNDKENAKMWNTSSWESLRLPQKKELASAPEGIC